MNDLPRLFSSITIAMILILGVWFAWHSETSSQSEKDQREFIIECGKAGFTADECIELRETGHEPVNSNKDK